MRTEFSQLKNLISCVARKGKRDKGKYNIQFLSTRKTQGTHKHSLVKHNKLTFESMQILDARFVFMTKGLQISVGPQIKKISSAAPSTNFLRQGCYKTRMSTATRSKTAKSSDIVHVCRPFLFRLCHYFVTIRLLFLHINLPNSQIAQVVNRIL